jgi:hypothetical protein
LSVIPVFVVDKNVKSSLAELLEVERPHGYFELFASVDDHLVSEEGKFRPDRNVCLSVFGLAFIEPDVGLFRVVVVVLDWQTHFLVVILLLVVRWKSFQQNVLFGLPSDLILVVPLAFIFSLAFSIFVPVSVLLHLGLGSVFVPLDFSRGHNF